MAGEGDEDPVVAPEVPRGGPIRQPVLHDPSDGDGHHLVGVVTSRQDHIGRVSVAILAAAGAVMLRIGKVDLMGSPAHQVTQIVQEPFDAPQLVGSSAATRALAACVVAAAADDFGLRQVLDTRDALCHIGKVCTGSGHGHVLQGMLCSPGDFATFPLSTPEKLCSDAIVSGNSRIAVYRVQSPFPAA